MDVNFSCRVGVFFVLSDAGYSIAMHSNITPLIPLLIALLNPPSPGAEVDPNVFTPASDTLQEIMTRSPLSAGAGTATLTEPLLVWLDVVGTQILQADSSCTSKLCQIRDR